jgi:hypothetical protein
MSITVVSVPRPGSFVRWNHTAAADAEEQWQPKGHLCWHCCHPFEKDTVVPMPLTYDSRTAIFRVAGEFCSLNCVYAYNRDTGKTGRGYGRGEALAIFQFAKAVTGSASKAMAIVASPPRQMLRAFGGWMSIDEFRACRTTYASMPAKCVLIEQVYHDKMRSESKMRGHISHPINKQTTAAPQSSGELLKLKGTLPKKKKRKTILEETLGV